MFTNQKGDSLPILITIVVLIGALTAGYFLYQSSDSQDYSDLQVNPSPSSSIGDGGKEGEVKEYANTNLDFSFNYDGASVITEKENNIAGSNLIYELEVNNPKFNSNEPYLALAINKNSSECPVKNTDLKNPQTSQVIISGQPAVLTEGEGAYSIYRRSVCAKDNKGNLFWFVSDYPINSPDDLKSERSKLFNEILASFKFASSNPVSDTNALPEGQSCGRNAGAGGDAKCAPGLICKYSSKEDETSGIGLCIKP